MKILLLILKVTFFLYFALNAFNVLQDPHKKAEEFKKEYRAFEKSIRERCDCKWPELLEAVNLTKYSLQIVKYGYYIQFVAAIGVLLHYWFAVLVGLAFLFFQTIHLNFGTLGLSTKFTEWEVVSKVVVLVLACLAFSFCGICENGKKYCDRKLGQKEELRKTVQKEDVESQPQKKKNDITGNEKKKNPK